MKQGWNLVTVVGKAGLNKKGNRNSLTGGKRCTAPQRTTVESLNQGEGFGPGKPEEAIFIDLISWTSGRDYYFKSLECKQVMGGTRKKLRVMCLQCHKEECSKDCNL